MKKLILLLLLIPSSYAFYLSDITDKAIDLKANSTIATVYNIDSWIESNIRYQFYYYPRGLRLTWSEMKGDCTDKAILKWKMLNDLGIKARLVHGYQGPYKHDWFEYYYKGAWYNMEYSNVTKAGYGIW